MTTVWVVLPVVLSLGLADRPEIVDVPLLYGIASLVVRSDSIEVTKDDSLPPGLDLRTKFGSVSKATIKVDESFDVTDGHHLGHSFKLLSINKGAATLEMVFWTAFLGAEPTRSTSTTQVRSYVTRRKGGMSALPEPPSSRRRAAAQSDAADGAGPGMERRR